MPTIWTIGYERLLPAELVAELQGAGVERLIDVRYESRKALGTPPDIRFHYKSGRPAEGAPLFRAHAEAHAAHELDDLAAELDRGPRTALMCLEADPAVCHRRALTELLRVRRPGLKVVDL